MLPSGSASPFVYLVAHPETATEPAPECLLGDDGSLQVVTGDVRDLRHGVIADASLSELLAAWRCADGLRSWAHQLCDAVEAEVAENRPGDACKEWAHCVFLVLPRLMLISVIRDARWSPADQAVAAVEHLHMRQMIRTIQMLVPNADWTLLRQAPFFPPPLAELIGV